MCHVGVMAHDMNALHCTVWLQIMPCEHMGTSTHRPYRHMGFPHVLQMSIDTWVMAHSNHAM